MNISKIKTSNNTANFAKNYAKIHKKFANSFAKMDDIGEAASIAFDFAGKAIVVPSVIMLASKEPKEKKEYSAFKNPVAAIIQLFLEVPILLLGSKYIKQQADKGAFDKGESKRYNEKFFKNKFVAKLAETAKGQPIEEKTNTIIEILNKKELSRKLTQNIEDFINTFPKQSKEILENSFNEYKATHKNLFHLQNRICFIAAIIMTPLLCALENKLHPIIMDKIYEKEQKTAHEDYRGRQNINKINHAVSIHDFVQRARRQK